LTVVVSACSRSRRQSCSGPTPSTITSTRCREQIAQETDRRALHLAEVLALALRGDVSRSRFPERAWARDHGAAARRHGTLLALAAAAAAGWTVYRRQQSQSREQHGGIQ
jgi:hypothetical protein